MIKSKYTRMFQNSGKIQKPSFWNTVGNALSRSAQSEFQANQVAAPLVIEALSIPGRSVNYVQQLAANKIREYTHPNTSWADQYVRPARYEDPSDTARRLGVTEGDNAVRDFAIDALDGGLGASAILGLGKGLVKTTSNLVKNKAIKEPASKLNPKDDLLKLKQSRISEISSIEGRKRLESLIGKKLSDEDYKSVLDHIKDTKIEHNSGLGTNYSWDNIINIDGQELRHYEKELDVTIPKSTTFEHEFGHSIDDAVRRKTQNGLKGPFAGNLGSAIKTQMRKVSLVPQAGNKIGDRELIYYFSTDDEVIPHLLEWRRELLENGTIKGNYDVIDQKVLDRYIQNPPRTRMGRVMRNFNSANPAFKSLLLEKYNTLPTAVPVVGGATILNNKNEKD